MKILLQISRMVLIFCLLQTNKGYSQIPKLESHPGSNYVVYLDFDGAIVSGTSWNSSYTGGAAIIASASTQGNTGITNVWKQVSEDFRPFDLNITTDSAVYNSAAAGKRMWVVITSTSSWFGAAGGVAYLNSFTWTSKTPCWAFENYLGYTDEYIAECVSHEVGHTLSLVHQSYYTSGCAKTEYNPGTGTGFGQIGWAPIMGVGYYTNMTLFHNGTSTSGCSTRQDDWAKLLTNNGFGLKPDEYGNTTGTATTIPMTGTSYDTSGIILDSNDVDYLKLALPSAATISITAVPFNLGTNNKKANLDIRLELQNSSGTVLYYSDSSTILNAFINSVALSAGNYYIKIDGVGSAYYTDYGSVGKYNLHISSTVALSVESIQVRKEKVNRNAIIHWQYDAAPIQQAFVQYAQKENFKNLSEIPIDLSGQVQVPEDTRYARIKLKNANGVWLLSEVLNFNNLFTSAVFYNPNESKLEIAGKWQNTNTIQVYNSLGSLVYSGSLDNARDLKMVSGMYLYTVNQQMDWTGKFLVSK